MRALFISLAALLILVSGCLRIEEEPIMTVSPTALISAHIKNQQAFATVQINVNPGIISPGNLPIYYEYEGELAIYNTRTGTVIDLNSFSGGGLSQYYTVAADTTTHDRFIVVAQGSIDAVADINDDKDVSNDRIVATGEFHSELELIVSELVSPSE